MVILHLCHKMSLESRTNYGRIARYRNNLILRNKISRSIVRFPCFVELYFVVKLYLLLMVGYIFLYSNSI